MTLYDFVLVRSLGMKVSKWKTIKVSWIANSLNNVLGFGGLSGAGLRTILYKEHVDDVKKLIRGSLGLRLRFFSGCLSSAFSSLPEFCLPGICLQKNVGAAGCCRYGDDRSRCGRHFNDQKKRSRGAEKGMRLSVFFSYLGASVIEWVAAAAVMYYSLATMGVELDLKPSSAFYDCFGGRNDQSRSRRIRFVRPAFWSE